MAALHTISKGRLRMQLQEIAGDAVAFYPAFRKVLGLNAAATQFLSQAVYWTERTDDGWFYKTTEEWNEELGLTLEEVKGARKKLKSIGLLTEQRKGIPAKLYYKVDTDELLAVLSGEKPLTVVVKTPKLEVVKPTSSAVENPRSITETTQETTAETTSLALLPAVAVKKRQPKQNVEAEQARQEACREIWGSYAQAYVGRYGAMPVRNAKVNRQVVDLWKRLGAEAAPVAEFFVSINDSYLIRNCHDLGSLLTKAESYRTQWATGRQMNGRTARQLEDTQANINAAQEAARRIQDKGGRNEFL
ncbi:helix-turn-helix domain-containing protein [Pseudomonas sp. NPDC077408]